MTTLLEMVLCVSVYYDDIRNAIKDFMTLTDLGSEPDTRGIPI